MTHCSFMSSSLQSIERKKKHYVDNDGIEFSVVIEHYRNNMIDLAFSQPVFYAKKCNLKY